MTIENIVNEIEDAAVMRGKANHEIVSTEIGELVLEKLNQIDKVAYIRFASVYRHFEDMDQFVKEIQKLGGQS
jgi:transcriptional repressor NrdR